MASSPWPEFVETMRKISLRKSLFILPNLLTLLSVLCGYDAIVLCSGNPTDDDFYRAALLIVFAMFFDTMDGRVARLTRTQSAIGVQLDSLADVLSFGMAPAVLVYRWSLQQLGTTGLLLAFGYLACGAIRLARFNVLAMSSTGAPKKPGKYILGLPIPAAAGILISIVVAQTRTGALSNAPTFIAIVVVALSFFMVSTIRFRSFKDLRPTWRTAGLVALAIGSTTFVAIHFHPSIALVWLVASYVTIGLVEAILRIGRRIRRPVEASNENDPD